MISVILKGIFIGLLSSAPMGPVGMLCIQRTLNKGRSHGLVTGLGATAGDVIYAIITLVGAFGLSFIIEYMEKHQAGFQLAGSLVLLIFGYVVYNQNPSKSLTKLSDEPLPVGKIFASSIALTLSNIAMPFLYIALFARFGIIDYSNMQLSWLVIPAIAAGAILWWLFITYIVDKLRSKFNPRGLKVFNRIVGSILMIIGAVGIISSIYMLASGTAF